MSLLHYKFLYYGPLAKAPLKKHRHVHNALTSTTCTKHRHVHNALTSTTTTTEYTNCHSLSLSSTSSCCCFPSTAVMEMCTLEKRGNVFILTLTGLNEHRLNPALLDSIQSALHRVRSESSSSTALITTAHGKFFSNGYDLAWAKTADTNHRLKLMDSKLRSLIVDLISLPVPTIAAVTGHASAAGFILALSHDYVLMRKDRGFLYMSELDIGLPIAAWFMAVIRSKIWSPVARREVLLRAAKLTAEKAAGLGVVEAVEGGAEETVAAAVRLGEELVGMRWDGHAYGQMRMAVFADLLSAVRCDEEMDSLAVKVASRL